MARKATKRRSKNAAGGKHAPKQAQAAPRTAGEARPPGTPTSPGSSVPAVVPPSLPDSPRKQKWTDLPEDSRIREKAAAIVAMKIQGFDNEEIATKLNLSVRSLRQYLWIAGKNGWLKTSDPHDVAEYEITHDVVKGLKELVAYRDKETGLPRQEVILRSAEGLGIFKDHSKPQQEQVNHGNVLTVNVVFPEGPRDEMRPGTTAGVASYVEGEVLNGSTPEPGRLYLPSDKVPEV